MISSAYSSESVQELPASRRHIRPHRQSARRTSGSAQTEVTINGKKLLLSNLDKVLYPQADFTKAHVIEYYMRVAPVLLPHLKNHALTLKRYPEGVEGQFFYEKHCPSFRPPWVKTARVWSKSNQENVDYCLANDLPSLLWAANLADLELHTSLARYPKHDQPSVMVFDLDPGPGADVIDCAKVAIWLEEKLAAQQLKSFPKTSGSKGLQIYVPLNSNVTFDQTKTFARNLAESLATEHPETVVANMSKRLRNGRIFIDWSQNDDHKTTVCVYSLRAKPRPTVSTPLQWSEIEAALKADAPDQLSFEASEVVDRVLKFGDLFEPVLTLKQKLP